MLPLGAIVLASAGELRGETQLLENEVVYCKSLE